MQSYFSIAHIYNRYGNLEILGAQLERLRLFLHQFLHTVTMHNDLHRIMCIRSTYVLCCLQCRLFRRNRPSSLQVEWYEAPGRREVLLVRSACFESLLRSDYSEVSLDSAKCCEHYDTMTHKLSGFKCLAGSAKCSTTLLKYLSARKDYGLIIICARQRMLKVFM